jgi:predicted DCC family thiol-disulfide oxidoreductase YuxK
MNTKIIIYDDNCPLCSAYTNAFVKTGLLDKDGRKNFSNITPELLAKIDLKKSVNEIPVIDTASGQVWYGIDALLEILQQKIPFVTSFGNIHFVKWALTKFYKFISYNRRLIVASKRKNGNIDCTPSFNIPYRFAFILIFLFFDSMILFPLHQFIISKSIFASTGILQLQAAHAILVLLNIFIASLLNTREGFEYLGQINMLALVVILLTIPLIAINKYSGSHFSSFNNFYLGAVAVFTVQEYMRRMRFIDFIKKYPTIILINIFSMTGFIIYLIF